jgi:UrcA family protein
VFEIEMDPASVMLFTSWHISTRQTLRRHDMTRSIFKFALPLTLALAAVSGAALAQEKAQSSQITIQGQPVEVTTVGRSYTGVPIVQYSFERAVSYANLDLSTSSGAAELKNRVRETAREACDELSATDPLDAPDDDGTCVREATAGAMKQVTAAIAAANSGNSSTTKVSAS